MNNIAVDDDTLNNLYHNAVIGSLSREAFLKRIGCAPDRVCAYADLILSRAALERNERLLAIGLGLGLWGGVSEETVELLTVLLREPWHALHEDVIWLIQRVALPEIAIASAVAASMLEFEYHARSDRGFALKRKCVYLLGELNTPEARRHLSSFASSPSPVLREVALAYLEDRDPQYPG